MHITKLRISTESTGKVRALSQRAGLTPNLVCRMAMMVSFENGAIKNEHPMTADGQEFNAYTLFGAHESIYLDMLRFVEADASDKALSDEDLLDRLGHHIDRGVRQLAPRIKTPADAAFLLASEDVVG